jgi:Fic family protein
MRDTFSMSARREITKKHAAEYRQASKKAKGVMLDQLVATTGWSRATARRALTAALQRKGPAKAAKRKPRSRTYGYDTLKLLIQVCKLAGRSSRKHVAVTMLIWMP